MVHNHQRSYTDGRVCGFVSEMRGWYQKGIDEDQSSLNAVPSSILWITVMEHFRCDPEDTEIEVK